MTLSSTATVAAAMTGAPAPARGRGRRAAPRRAARRSPPSAPPTSAHSAARATAVAHHAVDLRAGRRSSTSSPDGGLRHRVAVRRARLELDPHGRLEHARANAPVGQRHVDLDPRPAEARERDARTDASEVRVVDVRAREAQAHQAADHAGHHRDHGEQQSAATGDGWHLAQRDTHRMAIRPVGRRTYDAHRLALGRLSRFPFPAHPLTPYAPLIINAALTGMPRSAAAPRTFR